MLLHVCSQIQLFLHCVKSVHIRSFSGPYFPAFGLITKRCEYLSVFSPNAGKYAPEKTPYLDTFHVVLTFIILLALLDRL